MSSIKNLKSGTVPCSHDGNSQLPPGAAALTLSWDQMAMTDVIKKQANASHAVAIRKPSS